MPAILRDLPFFDAGSRVEVYGKFYHLVGLEIVAWASLAPQGVDELHAQALRFPALLDPAFTGSFLIHEQHLRSFAGYELKHLRQVNVNMRTADRIIPMYAANAWLHPNRPGQRDTFLNAAPFLLELHHGIGVNSGADLYPRLPLLGARALRGAGLRLAIDYDRCRVNLRTRPRFWPFG